MKLLLFGVTSLILAACATPDTQDHILREAVYEVSDRDCRGKEEAVQSCEAITVVELVKGNFYGIPDGKLAFVLWSGEKDNLTYVARKLDDFDKSNGEPGIVIFRDDGHVELLSRSNDGSLVYSFGKEGNLSSLSLRELSVGEYGQYSRKYPGND